MWLSAARGLTRAQRREALAVLSGRSEGEASKAAIELGVDEARRCPHCSSEGAVSRGMARGLRRYQCKGCGRTFNALSGTPLSGLHHKERWLSFGASLAKGETVKASAARCDVAVSTAFRWRHRFLAAARSDSEVLKGIVEADETYVLESRKGARGLGRKARRRGGKAKKRGLSREQVPVLMAADRSGTTVSAVLPRVDAAALTAALDPVVAKDALLVSDGGASYPPCAAALGVSHEVLNRSMGERVRGDLHVQTVNSRHSRLKDFLRPRRGIATRYLDNYLSWFHLVGLAPGANDRARAKLTHRGNRAAGTAGGGSGAVLEAPALVAGLDDLAMMGETVEQRGGHLGVAEDGWPFAEGEVGGDDDRGALVEPAHEVEEQLPAGLGEGRVAEFVEDDEVAADELVRGAALASGAEFGLEMVDQVDDVVAAAPGALSDAGARWRRRDGSCRCRCRRPARCCACPPGSRRRRAPGSGAR